MPLIKHVLQHLITAVHLSWEWKNVWLSPSPVLPTGWSLESALLITQQLFIAALIILNRKAEISGTSGLTSNIYKVYQGRLKCLQHILCSPLYKKQWPSYSMLKTVLHHFCSCLSYLYCCIQLCWVAPSPCMAAYWCTPITQTTTSD